MSALYNFGWGRNLGLDMAMTDPNWRITFAKSILVIGCGPYVQFDFKH